jgi:hypothetical protein
MRRAPRWSQRACATSGTELPATDDADASDAEIAESIALLEDERAIELAGDMLRLYELVAGLRSDDVYGHGL